MQCEVIEAGEWRVVKLGGDIDMYASPTARAAILQSIRDNHPVVVDLSAVSYIDSSGIASLVEGLQAAKTKRLEFGLFGASAAVVRVLRLARLETVFKFFPALPTPANA
jgi:anti-sigma B factor antagonist